MSSPEPGGLDETAATVRARLAELPPGRPVNSHRLVVLPIGRARALAGMLEELARRLEPGWVAGPQDTSESYSTLAREIAQDLRRLLRA